MAHIMDLPWELLNTIITFLAMSSDGGEDLARAAATCNVFKTLSRQINVLRVVNCQNVMVVDHSEQHHHITGLLSRCVQAGNPSAEYMLAKAILEGRTPLWQMMLENYLTNSSIKCATHLPLTERRYIAKSLNSGSIADLPYILFFLEDSPHLHESYERLRPLRLLKSFIVEAESVDIAQKCHDLANFVKFFLGYEAYVEAGMDDAIATLFWYECVKATRADERCAAVEHAFLLLSLMGSTACRDNVILGLDTLFQEGPLSSW